MHIPRHPAALAASLLAIGTVGTGVAIAATNPGDQDPDFNGGQTRLVDFPAPVDVFDGQYDTATQVTVAPDGSIYVGGYVDTGCDCDDPDSPVSLGHLDAAGNPIAAFGTDGVITDGDHLLREGPTAFGFAPNGDLLVGGSARGAPQVPSLRAADDSIDGDFTVYHYDASGRFVRQAREDFDFGGVQDSFVRGFLPLDGGGQLVMGSAGDGNYTNNHFATITLGADDAITGENVDDQTQAAALTAGQQAGATDGSYVIAGAGQVYTPPINNDLRISEEGSPAQAWVLRRYDAAGTRDDSYGGDFPIEGASYVSGTDGSLAGDGATYLLGDVSSDGSITTQVVRFTADGQPDEAFGIQTVASIFSDEEGPFGAAYNIDAIAGTPDGKLIVVANHYVGFGGSETVVARLNTDGTLDTTFGDGGIRTLAGAPDADYMEGEDAAVQSDGKAVVAGDAGRNFKELALRSTRAAASLSDGEQQAYVTRLAGDPRKPVTTTTTDTTTTPATTATTTTTTTQTTTTTATTPKPVAAQSVPAKSCASRRAFKIRLRIPKGDKPVSATVKVNGKRVKVVKGSRLRSTIDLRGLPKGTVKVAITVKLSGTKKTLKGQRTYHTCVPKLADSIPVL